MTRSTLNPKEALVKIKDFYQTHRRMPSFGEIADLFGYASKNAARYLVDKLINYGLLEKDNKGKLLPLSEWRALPLLGSVKAGFPSPAEEELQDTISFDEFLVDNQESTYLVRVSGDSMIDAGIMPGDIVIVDRSKAARTGEIVIAEVDGEWTMKYLYQQQEDVRLIAANKNYSPIIPSQTLNVGGVVTGVVRKY